MMYYVILSARPQGREKGLNIDPPPENLYQSCEYTNKSGII